MSAALAASQRPRVVLVEDDPSIRGFVSMALEELDIELVECGDVAAALVALRRAPAMLVVTDIMLPGESGLALVARLAADPLLRGAARIVVFSAGLGADVRAALVGHGVWRLLHKPVSVDMLQSCVLDALAGVSGDAPAVAAPAPPSPVATDVDPDATRRRAVSRHFGGDAALYDQFRASCRAQFGADIDIGDRACADGDIDGLRRVLHSLKTVLLILGHEQAAEDARRCEAFAAAGEVARSGADWQALRTTLRSLAS